MLTLSDITSIIRSQGFVVANLETTQHTGYIGAGMFTISLHFTCLTPVVLIEIGPNAKEYFSTAIMPFFIYRHRKNVLNKFAKTNYHTPFQDSPSGKSRLTTGGIRCADHATPSFRKSWHYFAKKRLSLDRHSSHADQKPRSLV
jgi:hypothetical protein